MVTINQGRSSNKPHFLVADPFNTRAKVGDEILCIHPRNYEHTKGMVLARWSFNWDKDPLEGLILLEYGVTAAQLRAGLVALDAEFENPNVSLLLIKEIK